MVTAASQNPRYEPHENPPLLPTIGFGLQFAVLASTTLLVTPVIVAQESGRGHPYLIWMVFASLLVVGLSTLLQVRRLGPVGAGSMAPMFTAAFSIPFCITAVVDGGPATLTTLVLVTAAVQLIVSRWLFILRRIVTPTVGGIVMMILSITLASVVFGLLDRATAEPAEPAPALWTALITLVIVAALALRGSAVLRLWAPVVGIAGGCIAAAALGIYDIDNVALAPWVGLPSEWPGLGLDFGVTFWTLLPAFLFLGIIISIQANGEAIGLQRVSRRESRAVNFREVQGTMAGSGASNLLAGIVGAVPNIIHPGTVAFTQITGVASRRVGYCIGCIFIIAAFMPKVSGLLSTIPGPVMTGYLVLVTGTLFVDGARTLMQNEQDRQKIVVAGVCFWIGAAFQFGLFNVPDFGPVIGALLKSGVTTGGFAAVLMILYLELTNPRRMRFHARLHADCLPELDGFIVKFAERRGWNTPMKERLRAAAEETLLTLAPMELEESEETKDDRQLIVLASSEGQAADLEFIGGGSDVNVEDQVRQLQQHDVEGLLENELSLRLLRNYASSVRHQQYHGTDIITIRVTPPKA